MLLLYLVVIILGAATLLISVIIYLKKQDIYRKFFIALIATLMAFLLTDFFFYRLPDVIDGLFANGLKNLVWIPDLAYISFTLSWIMLLGAFTGNKMIMPLKLIFAICTIYFILTVVLVQTEQQDIIRIVNMIFDLFIVMNGVFYMFSGIRMRGKTQEKTVLIALGISVSIYAVWVAIGDYIVVGRIVNGLPPEWPNNPLLFVAIVLEIVTIMYFFMVDPLNIRLTDKNSRIEKKLIEQFNLTEREREILILLSKGLSNSQIAEQAYITENTVKRHLTSIYKKTDTTNRFELITKVTKGI